MPQKAREDTTIPLHNDTRDRLKGLKPYKSMSYNELLAEMADVYERHDTASAHQRGGKA